MGFYFSLFSQCSRSVGRRPRFFQAPLALLGFQVGVEITMPIAFAEAWPVMTWKIVFTSCKEESFLKGFSRG